MPLSDEVDIFTAAYQEKIPVILKGPTGCGKTRFHRIHGVAAWPPHHDNAVGTARETRTARRSSPSPRMRTSPRATSLAGSCLRATRPEWVDGPLTRAVKTGAICYLDEVVEARKDTTVLIHPLTDHRRLLPVEKRGQILEAADGFLLVISYNPGYQSALKDLKQSTRQRFVAMEFTYPHREAEAQIVQSESGVDEELRRPAGPPRRESPQPQGARPAGGRLHTPADLRREADFSRRRAPPRLRCGHFGRPHG